MIRINRQTDYAIRVVLALSMQDPNTRTPTSTIQKEMIIPASFTPRIVAQLANTGLIKTFPGRDGGLMLARPAAEINLLDVITAFEGPLLLSECMQVAKEDDCPYQENCHVRSKWGRVQAVMLREMAAVNFADLAEETRLKNHGSAVPVF